MAAPGNCEVHRKDLFPEDPLSEAGEESFTEAEEAGAGAGAGSASITEPERLKGIEDLLGLEPHGEEPQQSELPRDSRPPHGEDKTAEDSLRTAGLIDSLASRVLSLIWMIECRDFLERF